MKYVFVVNPTAGKGNLQDGIIRNIKSYFENSDLSYEIYITKSPGDAESYAKKLAETGEEVCIFACGGEGTFYEVLNGTVTFENVRLGVIPCGSANDFLKIFDSTENFRDISSQVNGIAVKTDIIKAGDRYCINGCSAGMDAIVAKDMSIFKNWPLVSGKTAYNLAIVKTFLKKAGVVINLSVDGSEFRQVDCLFAVIANAPYYGGGYMAAPGAVPFDGKLNFTLVNTVSKLKIPGFLKKYKVGDIKGFPFCKLGLCEKMGFTADVPIPVNLDGEIIETKSMEFSIVKEGISFIIPKNTVTVSKN